jgi:hypothetical protein
MVMRAQQQQVFETGVTARRPVFGVVGIDKARVVASPSQHKRSFNPGLVLH